MYNISGYSKVIFWQLSFFTNIWRHNTFPAKNYDVISKKNFLHQSQNFFPAKKKIWKKKFFFSKMVKKKKKFFLLLKGYFFFTWLWGFYIGVSQVQNPHSSEEKRILMIPPLARNIFEKIQKSLFFPIFGQNFGL